MNNLYVYLHTIQNMYNRYLHDILHSIFIKYLQYLYQYSETTNVNNDPPVDLSSGSCSDFRSLKDDIYICIPILVSYCSTLPLNLYLEKVRTVGLANNNSQPSFSFTPADHFREENSLFVFIIHHRIFKTAAFVGPTDTQ